MQISKKMLYTTKKKVGTCFTFWVNISKTVLLAFLFKFYALSLSKLFADCHNIYSTSDQLSVDVGDE